MTTTEKDFIAYLKQRKISFKREPYNDLGPCPDFLIVSKGRRILIEVKEIESTPFNKAIAATREVKGIRTFSLDPRALYDELREKVKRAARQLKPYADRVDYTAVLLGFPTQYRDVSLDDLFYSMYGDPVITFQVNNATGSAVTDPGVQLKYTGGLRKIHPDTREPESPHKDYLGGVGIITSFNARAAYQSRYFGRLKRKPKDPHALFDYYNRRWGAHEKHVPKGYRDPARTLVRVELVANVLGAKVLPRDIFNGRWDRYREPRVVRD